MLISAITAIALIGMVHLTDDVASSSGGVVGKTETGCTCHSATPSGEVTPRIEGLPSTYVPGKVYELDLSYTGTPPGGGAVKGGFNLWVEDGTLLDQSGDTSVRIGASGREATHSSTGNRQTSWKVQWRAPDEPRGDIDVTLVVNVVNGDGSPGEGDNWGRTRTTVGGEGGGSIYVLVGLVVIIIILAALVLTRRPAPRSKGRPRRKGGKRGNRRSGRGRRGG